MTLGDAIMITSPATPRIGVSTDVAIPVRDGVILVADVYLPEEAATGGARVPAILERTPYDRQRPELQEMAQFFAGRGYAVVLQDCRGRFDSGGDFSFSVNSREHLDGYDTVEWIAQQPWSAGRVGTTGLSFAGSTQQALAVMQPPHLTTQVILDAGYNYWDRLVRHGGAFSEGVHLPYALWMAASGHEARADPTVRAALLDALAHIDEWIRRRPLRRGSSPLAHAPTYEAWYFAIAEGGDYDARWRNPQASLGDYIDRYPDIPLCLVTSWYGHHAGANLIKFRTLTARNRSKVKLVIGPWVHGFRYMEETCAGGIDLGDEAVLSLYDFQLDWFDRWLRPGSPSPPEGHSVDFFVMGGGDGHILPSSRLAHGGAWHRTGRWPPV